MQILFEDIGPMVRSYEVKLIANERNERLEHKHIFLLISILKGYFRPITY